MVRDIQYLRKFGRYVVLLPLLFVSEREADGGRTQSSGNSLSRLSAYSSSLLSFFVSPPIPSETVLLQLISFHFHRDAAERRKRDRAAHRADLAAESERMPPSIDGNLFPRCTTRSIRTVVADAASGNMEPRFIRTRFSQSEFRGVRRRWRNFQGQRTE